MIIVIILIYTLTSIGFALNWSFVHSAFITMTNRQNFWTMYLMLSDTSDKAVLSMGITGILCNILADSIMIWRCWVIWGRHWLIVLLPTLCLVSSIAFKSINMYMVFAHRNQINLLYPVLYVSFNLVTMIWYTLGIVYHILSIGGNLRAYRCTIEILVESSTLYSVALILYVAFVTRNNLGASYLDSVAAVARGIAPTLIVGRVAVGYARPDDSWEGSVMSSLRFGGNQISTSSQGSTIASIDDDLEAQLESEDKCVQTQTCF
ncbi:uncharacterized protein EV420DRAFT_1709737, partial [Desarmillaria tabescens]